MTEVILVVLRRPERAVTLLNAAKCFSALTGGVRINVLAIREPIQITGLAAKMLIGEADAVLEAREQERKRVLAVKAAFNRWTVETGEVAHIAHWIEVEGNAATIVGERGRRAGYTCQSACAFDRVWAVRPDPARQGASVIR